MGKSGKANRQRGDRYERKTVELLKGHGLEAERVPLSGAAGGSFTQDVICERHQIEVKARKPENVYWRTVEKHLAGADMLMLWEDKKKTPLVVVHFDFIVRALNAMKRG